MGLFSSSSSNNNGGGSRGFSKVSTEQMRNKCMKDMEAKGLKSTLLDESDNIVFMSFGGKRYDTFVLLDFDEETYCTSVHLSSQSFAKCDSSKLPAVVLKLNELNKRFRWVKFWVNDDCALTCDADSLVKYETVGDDCAELAIRMSNILEDALEALEGLATLDEETANQLKFVAILKQKMG